MTEASTYKKQLEDLIHLIRSPLVTLSITSKSIITLYKDNDISISTSKVDEYTESLSLIQASIKKINKILCEAEENMLIINQKGV